MSNPLKMTSNNKPIKIHASSIPDGRVRKRNVQFSPAHQEWKSERALFRFRFPVSRQFSRPPAASASQHQVSGLKAPTFGGRRRTATAVGNSIPRGQGQAVFPRMRLANGRDSNIMAMKVNFTCAEDISCMI